MLNVPTHCQLLLLEITRGKAGKQLCACRSGRVMVPASSRLLGPHASQSNSRLQLPPGAQQSCRGCATLGVPPGEPDPPTRTQVRMATALLASADCAHASTHTFPH